MSPNCRKSLPKLPEITGGDLRRSGLLQFCWVVRVALTGHGFRRKSTCLAGNRSWRVGHHSFTRGSFNGRISSGSPSLFRLCQTRRKSGFWSYRRRSTGESCHLGRRFAGSLLSRRSLSVSRSLTSPFSASLSLFHSLSNSRISLSSHLSVSLCRHLSLSLSLSLKFKK